MAGCLLAFSLADSSFSSKIQSDFLHNEKEFNEIIKYYESTDIEDGTYEIESKEEKYKIIFKKCNYSI